MRIENNTIIFKSTPENYITECSGLKANTIRHISLWSEMKIFERFYNKFNLLQHNMYIKIINTDTRESFERTLTDISQFEGLWVFSWRAE